MQIIDCRKTEAFEDICRTLADKVRQGGTTYDLFVGVATGGEFVGDIVVRHVQPEGPYLVVKRQRLSTQGKGKVPFLKKVVRFLPAFVQDWLRQLEVRVAEARFERNRDLPRTPGNVVVVREVGSIDREIRTVLVIDDCVDSGGTLLDVMNFLKSRYPGCSVHNAALTLTHRNPWVWPEYLLLERGIVKCPWSLDG